MKTLHRPRPAARPETPPAAHSPTKPARNLAQISVFAGIIAVLGLPGAIPVLGMAVPVTAQTLGVMLAGAVLGPWRGAGAVLLFNALVAMGLPLLSGGRGGMGVFFGPSAGYVIGWIAGAAVVGLIVHGLGRTGRARPTWPRVLIGGVLGGMLVIYAFGIPVQAYVTQLGLAETALLAMAFLPGDLLKVIVAAMVTMTLRRTYPRAFDR